MGKIWILAVIEQLNDQMQIFRYDITQVFIATYSNLVIMILTQLMRKKSLIIVEALS